MNHPITVACGAVALCTSLAAFAQPAVKLPPTQLRYSSAFADYKPWQDSPPGDWRRINDDVGSRGGMGMPMPMPMPMPIPMPMPMPAAQPASAASSAAAPMPAMKHGGHAGHGGRP